MTENGRQAPEPDRLTAGWLLTVAVMVLVMVVLGGLTRLTHSGLSMVEWKPLTGWLPPLSDAAWQAQFAAYQRYPEFRLLNPEMTVDGFKSIFWLEFVHRLWGRLIGLAFFVPFLVFLIRGRIRGRLAVGCAVLFALGALQGLLGWLMVQSGLVDNPDVSAYRLAIHFVMALLLLAALVWTALTVLHPMTLSPSAAASRGRVRAGPLVLALLILTTLSSGAFVAGTDAGFLFNTFPLMDGQVVPEDAFDLVPAWRNAFENPALVQFIHRALALSTLAAVIVWRAVAASSLAAAGGGLLLAANLLLAALLLQVGLGISTLLLHMPIAIAAWHQANGVLVWALAVWVVFESRGLSGSRPVGVAGSELAARISRPA
ncbi:MAG: COX15/CtaA family protein [Rhodospirillales bacterium]